MLHCYILIPHITTDCCWGELLLQVVFLCWSSNSFIYIVWVYVFMCVSVSKQKKHLCVVRHVMGVICIVCPYVMSVHQ